MEARKQYRWTKDTSHWTSANLHFLELDALEQIHFPLSVSKLGCGILGQNPGHLVFFVAGGTEPDEGFADRRIQLGRKGDLRLPAAFQTFIFIMAK